MDCKNKKGLMILLLLLIPSVMAQQPQIPEREIEDRVTNAVDNCIAYQNEQFIKINERFDDEKEAILADVDSRVRWFKVSFALTFLGAMIIGFAILQYISFKLGRKKREFEVVTKQTSLKSPKNGLKTDSKPNDDYEVFYGGG